MKIVKVSIKIYAKIAGKSTLSCRDFDNSNRGDCYTCPLVIEALANGHIGCSTFLSFRDYGLGHLRVIPESGVFAHKLGRFYV